MTIYYFCPRPPKPTGGVKQIHRHVESLVGAGIDARVLLDHLPLAGWFPSAAPRAVLHRSTWYALAQRLKRSPDYLDWTKIPEGPEVAFPESAVSGHRVRLGHDDILVMPEFYGRGLKAPAFGARLVIFNQNAHYTYNGYTAEQSLDGFAYLQPATTVITVSAHNRDYIAHACPGADVYLTPNGVDCDVFRPAPKRKRIAYMPRKRPQDLVQVLQILRGRGRLAGWELLAIDQMPEPEVARALGESAVFLSSCDEEGFGLPPLEAAACACAVVGYTGYAAREFMREDLCHPVAQGDVLGFAQTLERVLEGHDHPGGAIQAQAQAHAAFVREHYSRQVEGDSVLRAWAQIAPGLKA